MSVEACQTIRAVRRSEEKMVDHAPVVDHQLDGDLARRRYDVRLRQFHCAGEQREEFLDPDGARYWAERASLHRDRVDRPGPIPVPGARLCVRRRCRRCRPPRDGTLSDPIPHRRHSRGLKKGMMGPSSELEVHRRPALSKATPLKPNIRLATEPHRHSRPVRYTFRSACAVGRAASRRKGIGGSR